MFIMNSREDYNGETKLSKRWLVRIESNPSSDEWIIESGHNERCDVQCGGSKRIEEWQQHACWRLVRTVAGWRWSRRLVGRNFLVVGMEQEKVLVPSFSTLLPGDYSKASYDHSFTTSITCPFATAIIAFQYVALFFSTHHNERANEQTKMTTTQPDNIYRISAARRVFSGH